jgi:hypothetical protein
LSSRFLPSVEFCTTKYIRNHNLGQLGVLLLHAGIYKKLNAVAIEHLSHAVCAQQKKGSSPSTIWTLQLNSHSSKSMPFRHELEYSLPTSECAIIGLVDQHHNFVISTKLRNDRNIFIAALPPPAAVRCATSTKTFAVVPKKDPRPEPSEMNGLIQSLLD